MFDFLNSIPIASQTKSIVEASCGQWNEAIKTQEQFSKQCIGVSQVRSLVHLASGDKESAINTQREFIQGPGPIQGALIATSIFAPVTIVTALGFTTNGITAGSTAAAIMSSYGGNVSTGSICAIMQSIGATGLSGTAITTGVTSAGAVISGVIGRFFGCETGSQDEPLNDETKTENLNETSCELKDYEFC